MLINLLDSGEITLAAGENPIKAVQFPCRFIMLWPDAANANAAAAGLSGTGKQSIYIPAGAGVATYHNYPIYTEDANKIVVTGTVGQKIKFAIYG